MGHKAYLQYFGSSVEKQRYPQLKLLTSMKDDAKLLLFYE